MKKFILVFAVIAAAHTEASAAVTSAEDVGITTLRVDSARVDSLQEVVVRGGAPRRSRLAPDNRELISAVDLRRAACCTLAESFTTNPSVDVSYSDAATGARQIRLLGLSGTYVQTLAENLPLFRGAALPYGFGYVPGNWLQSIQVSKGAGSVKNGFESVTGQINIEVKKPQAEPQLNLNMYANHEGGMEFNADGNLHFGPVWSGGVMVHAQNAFASHDRNDDGFADMPRVRQIALANRWMRKGERVKLQFGVKGLIENRRSGQIIGHHHYHPDMPRYIIDIDTRRAEAWLKNAIFIDTEQNANIALMADVSIHDQHSDYGLRRFDIVDRQAYAQLMFERGWRDLHSLSAGLSLTYHNYHQLYRLGAESDVVSDNTHEAVSGGYAQYTFNLHNSFIAVAGLRYDYSSLYGSLLTPRLHLRYNPGPRVSLHASFGRGSRSPQPMIEYSYLLASSRLISLPASLRRENGWNAGLGGTWNFNVINRAFTLSAEYYYTRITHQLLANLFADPHAAIVISDGRSRSHTFQTELTAELLPALNLTAAWRLTDVRSDYGSGYRRPPLLSRSKGLVTLAYAPMMGLWQFDASLSINGSGVMPTPYTLADGSASWSSRFPTWCGLNVQVTRNFRHWSVYAGGENITNYRQPRPVIGASDPWSRDFDATMVWGPLGGAMIYVGFRYNLKLLLSAKT